ncbi:Cell division topological specificity factor [Methylobacterium crusticola]|uniref:Cell division topological specificity factor n=2 Tax=Methylobacterium crusticola TaxID=1697972 RepID=A0ABQ4QRW3_9HYPH|nr:cell division topological specificity factor MinE [Methylobacterium crusticola]GJD48033.1 Cell division topological specificity factor [Methylobacterium crusticola]
MNLLSFLSRRGTAPVARERLQILLAHERVAFGRSDLVAVLREEILAVIAKHVAIDKEKVKVTMERGESMSTLGVDIELPALKAAGLASA